MLGIGKKISWLLLVVFFVVLAAIAATFYEADQEERAEIKDNQFFKKGSEVISFISNFTGLWTSHRSEVELVDKTAHFLGNIKNIASGTAQLLPDEASDQEDNSALSVEVLSEKADPVLEELLGNGRDWLSEGKDMLSAEKSVNLSDRISEAKFWTYRKNESGAEIVLSSKEGQEYIIPLPFKFLSEKQ